MSDMTGLTGRTARGGLTRRAFGLGATTAALGAGMSVGRTQGALQTVKMALSNSVMTVIYPYVTNAQAFGFYAQEGIKDEVVMGQGSPQVLSLLVAGTVDIAMCNPEPVMQLVADRGLKLKSVYKLNQGAYILSVPDDSPLKSITDLRGKRLGMFSPQSGIDYLKIRLFEAGMTTNDLTIVPTGFGGQTIVAVRQKQVDAILYWPDATLMLRNTGLKLRELPKASWEDGLYISVAVTTDEAIRAKPEAIARTLRAMAQGQLLSAASPEKSVEAFWRQYPDQLPKPDSREKAFRDNVARIDWQNELNQTKNLTPEALQTHRWGIQSDDMWARMQDNLFRVGGLTKALPPRSFFDTQFEQAVNAFDRPKALARLGAVK